MMNSEIHSQFPVNSYFGHYHVFLSLETILYKHSYAKTLACVKVFKEVPFEYLLFIVFNYVCFCVGMYVGPKCWPPGPGITHSSQLSGSIENKLCRSRMCS